MLQFMSIYTVSLSIYFYYIMFRYASRSFESSAFLKHTESEKDFFATDFSISRFFPPVRQCMNIIITYN